MNHRILVAGLAVMVCAGLVVAGAPNAWGQNANQPVPAKPKSSSKAQTQAPAKPQAMTVQAAKANLDAAKAELKKAIAARDALSNTLKSKPGESQEVKAAEQACRQADADLKAVRDPILRTLKSRPEYIAALAQKDDAQRERRSLPSNASPEQVSAASAATLAAGTVVSKLETDALAAEPKVAEAQAKLVEARKNLEAVKKEATGNLRNDPQWQSALTAIAEKQDAVARAEAEYNSVAGVQQQKQQQFQAQLALQWQKFLYNRTWKNWRNYLNAVKSVQNKWANWQKKQEKKQQQQNAQK